MSTTVSRRRFLWTSATGALAACTGPEASDSGGTEPLGPAQPVPLNLQPWVALTDAGAAELRFETLEDVDLPVFFTVDGVSTQATVERRAEELDFAWPTVELPESAGVLPDVPGLHVLHVASLAELPADAEVSWTVHTGGGEVREGRFRTPPDSPTAFRMGWIADTMHPYSTDTFARLEALAPDWVLHGGDIQYQSSPADTWAGMSVKLAPTAATAAVWFAVGNHEYEAQDELEVMYERLHGEQGMPPTEGRWFRVQWGRLRVLVLDSEDGSTAEADSAQIAWLDAELADGSAAGDTLIVAFHRPLYTLSKHASEGTAARDVLHPRFVDAGVKLVLCGHVHAFERFDVDGVVYWVDGGGGALLYDTDEELEQVESWRPGEPDLRVAVDQSYGVTTLDVAADGAITVTRYDAETGEVQHQLELAP